MKLVLIITDKGKSDLIVKSCSKVNLLEPVNFIGKGTAPTEILDALSLAENDKDVVLALAQSEDIETIFAHLEEHFDFTKKGRGVACAMSLNGISSKTLDALTGQLLEGDNQS